MRQVKIAIALIGIFFACKKEVMPEPSINGPTVSNNITLAQKVDYMKAGLPPYDPRYSDTMAAARNGGGVAIAGNSQMERWVYYTWKASWQGVPVINRGIGGTTWLSTFPFIQKTITDYRPKVIVLYQGENEYNGMNIRADSINKHFIKYYNEVRRQNPAAHIIVLSMIKIPLLLSRGLESDINATNGYYQAKAQRDSNATYLDITAEYPRNNKALWRPDSIHLNNYAPLLIKLKPVVIARLADTTTTVPPPSPPVDTTTVPPPSPPVDTTTVPPPPTPVDTTTVPPPLPPVDTTTVPPPPTPVDTTTIPPPTPPPVDTTTIPPPPSPIIGAPIAIAAAADGTDTVIVPKSWNYNPFIYATRSTDLNGWIAGYRWNYVSGPGSYKIVTPTAGKTRLDSLVVGTYVFSVTVIDNKNLTSSDTVTVIITNK